MWSGRGVDWAAPLRTTVEILDEDSTTMSQFVRVVTAAADPRTLNKSAMVENWAPSIVIFANIPVVQFQRP